MRGEGVTQSVRVPEESAHGAGVESTSADGEEQSVDCPSRELGASVAQIASNVMRGLLAKGHDPLFPALAAHVDGLALEVHICEIEPDGFRAAEPAGIEKFEQRSVPKRERGVTLGQLEQRVDLGGLRRVRESARPPGRERRFGHRRGAESEAEARADRREAA